MNYLINFSKLTQTALITLVLLVVSVTAANGDEPSETTGRAMAVARPLPSYLCSSAASPTRLAKVAKTCAPFVNSPALLTRIPRGT